MTNFHNTVAKSLFKGSLPAWQREPLDKLLGEGLRRGRTLEETAYVLATAYHETARFKYTEEIGEGEGRDYGEPIWLIRGVRVSYFGRGHTQLTWLRNYAKMSVFLSLELGREIDLVNKPDLASEPDMAALIIWEGMIRGMFTGENLADYFDVNTGQADYIGARQIVNGNDKDELIAGYAREFEAALRLLDDEQMEVSGCGLSRSECPMHSNQEVAA